MPITIHNIQTRELEAPDGSIKKILACGFYLPFMREGAAFQVEVDAYPEESERQAFLLDAIKKDLGANPVLNKKIHKAIEEEKAYLQGQIETHDRHRAECVRRLEELNSHQ